MAMIPHSTRREKDEHGFHPAELILIPVLAIFLQVYLPLRFPSIQALNLPVLVVIYFAVSRRSPVAGTLIGMIIGIIQDAMTHLPLGINGIVDCIVGYMAASIGVRVDVENPGSRLIINFVFMLLASALHIVILGRLLGMHQQWIWVHQLIRAVVNALVGVVLFAVFDRLRRRV